MVRVLLGVWLCLAGLSLSFGASDHNGDHAMSRPADQPWPPVADGLVPDPAITFGTLDNGMRYALMPSSRPTREAFVQFYVDFGSLDETEDARGAAHFIEHMAFNGSKNIPEDALVGILQRLGLAFGADANAYTGFDRTVYTLDLPDTRDEVVDAALDIIREIAGNLLFEPGAVDRERGIIQSERRARFSPNAEAGEKELNFLLDGTLLPQRLPIGTVQVVDTISADHLKALYHAAYRPDNVLLVVTGDLDMAQIAKKIADRFAGWTAVGPPLDRPARGMVAPPAFAAEAFQSEGLPTRVGLYQIAPAIPPADSAAERMNMTRRSIAVSMFNRRLQSRIRSDNPPFLAGAFGYGNQQGMADIGSLVVVTEPDRIARGVTEIEQALRTAVLYGFDPSEYREQKANRRVGITQSVANADKRHGKALAGWLVGSYAAASVPTHPDSSAAIFEAATRDLTVDQLSDSFAALWSPDQPVRLFLRGRDGTAGAATSLLDAYRASTAIAVDAPVADRVDDFAYTDFGPKGRVVWRGTNERFGTKMIRFENGVALTLKPTDFRENTIVTRLSFGGGLQAVAPDQAPLATLMRSVFVSGGLGKHKVDALTRLMAGRTARANLGLDSDRFTMTAGVVPNDFELQMQLWAAYLSDPGYHSEAFSLFRRGLDALYETLDTTPQQVLQFQGGPILRSGDARFVLPPKDVLAAVTPAELKAVMTPILTESALEVAVVGTFDEVAVVRAVARTLGALPKRAFQLADTPYSAMHFPAAGTHKLTHKGAENQALYLISWPTTDRFQRKTVADLALLRAVIADRLREEIREALGATYSPGVASAPSRYPGYGQFTISIDAEPETLPKLEAVIARVVSDIRDGGITEDALTRARTPILESFESNLESNSYWLGVIDQLHLRGAEAEDYDLVRRRYQMVTAADIQSAAQRYLTADTSVIIRIVHENAEGAGGQADLPAEN